MKCLVVILSVVACVRVAEAAAGISCALEEEFFGRHNVSADDSDVPGPICGGECCGRGREERLRSSLRRTADMSAVAMTKKTAELLLSTRRLLQDHLMRLSHQSQNKTTTLFTQLYREHAARTVLPLATLYEDIRTVLRAERTDPESFSARAPKDLASSTKKFFRDIFPVAHHNVLKLESKQFTPQYSACLKDAYDVVQPFGDVPQQLGSTLSRSLEAARALLQMLAVGAEVLSTTEQVLSSASTACGDRLLRAAGCARCHGQTAPPCRNYCLNVARGCIGSLLSELDGPWAGYVTGVERLTKVDADIALRELETKVSKAIMYAIENRAMSENKVRQECGLPSTESSNLSSQYPPPGSMRRDNHKAPPPPDTELLLFAATLASKKKLFAGIADGLCDQLDFTVEDSTERCWNGNAVAEYTKPLVPSASLIDQKYNPEFTFTGSLPQDSRVTALADTLQQARQVLVSYSRNNEVTADAFMQGDEAGEEGSGSGRSYSDDYDMEGSGDDGSGDIQGRNGPDITESSSDTSTPRTSSSVALTPSKLAALLFAYLAMTFTA